MMNERFVKTISAAWRNPVIRHLIYWFCAFTFFFLTVLIYESASLALEVAVMVFWPAPVPVYLNLITLRYFFEKRRYALYFLSLVLNLIASSLLIEYGFYLFTDDPSSHTSGIGTALFFIVVTTGFRYYIQGLKQQYRLQEAEFKQVQTELSLLKAQIHPHFFFNTLNNLYALSLERSKEVPGVILKLSELMRYVLQGSSRKTVPLKDELQFIGNYLELEKLRLGSYAEIRFKVEGESEGREIAPMILVPFVENGFKHGLKASTNCSFLSISIMIQDSLFLFKVENNKPAGSTKRDDGSCRIGIENVKRRLELHYPGSHELIIDDGDSNYMVKLSIVL